MGPSQSNRRDRQLRSQTAQALPALVAELPQRHPEPTATQLPLSSSAPIRPSLQRAAIVVALFDFDGNLPEDLPFRKGDLMAVDNPADQSPWVRARHLTSHSQGYIPHNYVAEHTGGLEQWPWYFVNCNRPQAERMMLPPGLERGTFMIRKAADGNLALGIKDSDIQKGDVVRHYKIKSELTNNGCLSYYISPRVRFDTLDKLVAHYQENVDGLCCQLKEPCPRTRPVPQFRDMKIPRKSIILLRKLGSGTFGEVWLGKWNALEVAVKTIKGNSTNDDDFINEAKTMWKLQHLHLPGIDLLESRISFLGRGEEAGSIHQLGPILRRLSTLTVESPSNPAVGKLLPESLRTL